MRLFIIAVPDGIPDRITIADANGAELEQVHVEMKVTARDLSLPARQLCELFIVPSIVVLQNSLNRTAGVHN